LGNIGGEDPSAVADAIDPLITALQDDHRFVRKQAAEALGKIGSEEGSMVAEALGPLTTALGADNQDVRKQAAEAINRIQPDSYGLGIRSEIREINSRAAIVAMTHLQREPTLGVRPLIREQDVSKATLKNIERIATVVPAWVQPLAPDLRTLLHEDATETRVLACKILASLDDTQSYHQIADLAEEATDPAVQEAASDALTHLKTDDSNPTEPSVPTETAQAESEAELPTAHGQPPEQTPVPDPLPITRSDIAVQSELTDSDSHADRMARVFVAVDESSGRRCVLKELASDGPTKYGPPLQLLEKEGNIWRDFQQKHGVHEHIVRLYEEDTHRGLPWLAMEYMDGGSLRDRLADPADEISLPERLWICVRIAHALTFAHRHRVHHYDIKPANILFRSTGDETWPVPKLSDWGLAELGLTPEEIRSHNMYTPAYAAPEQIDPEHTGSRSARTDIHQFCIVAYELLTETHPFRDEFGRLVSGSASQITPPSEQIAHIPTGIDETILTGLSETPSDRHDSMSQVRDAFERGFQDIAAESDWMLPSH
jgi:hypothetical protein